MKGRRRKGREDWREMERREREGRGNRRDKK